MTNKSKREGFILKALDKVEKIGNGLPHPTPIIIVNTVPRAIKLVKLLIIEVYIYLILSADKRLTAIVSFVIKVLVAVS